MDPETKKPAIEEQLQERFFSLPKVIQDAITSAEVEKKLRDLSEQHKLHLDQWQKLENEVMFTLFGLQPVENLRESIKNEVAVSDEIATALTQDIAETIFKPIRKELENKTEGGETMPTEQKTSEEKNTENAQINPVSAVNPAQDVSQKKENEVHEAVAEIAVRPAPAVTSTAVAKPAPEKAIRAPISSSYSSQVPSHERTTAENDPYREQVN